MTSPSHADDPQPELTTRISGEETASRSREEASVEPAPKMVDQDSKPGDHDADKLSEPVAASDPLDTPENEKAEPLETLFNVLRGNPAHVDIDTAEAPVEANDKLPSKDSTGASPAQHKPPSPQPWDLIEPPADNNRRPSEGYYSAGETKTFMGMQQRLVPQCTSDLCD